MDFDTIDSFEDSPNSKLSIVYLKPVEFGQELKPSEVKETPLVEWEASPTVYYTLVMYDPDAPSQANPSLADVKHWLVVNIPGNDVNSGEVIAEYIGSGASKGTGLHRYIFLVFEQPDKLSFDEPKSGKKSLEHRRNWSMRQFMKKYNLGKPFAGNFFKAQWEPYVDEFRKQFEETPSK